MSCEGGCEGSHRSLKISAAIMGESAGWQMKMVGQPGTHALHPTCKVGQQQQVRACLENLSS